MPASGKGSNRNNTPDSVRARRTEQLKDIGEVLQALNERLTPINSKRRQLARLQSVSLGLYEELDKLSKKAPAEKLTELALEQVNEVIRETRELIQEDPYIQRLHEFVPAGDNPENRDAVLVLRQARQGQERYASDLALESERIDQRISEAKLLQTVTELALGKGEPVNGEDVEILGRITPSKWFPPHTKYQSPSDSDFDFDRLDTTDIKNYFLLD